MIKHKRWNSPTAPPLLWQMQYWQAKKSYLQVSEKLIELSELEQFVHSLAEIGGKFQRQFR